MKRNSCLLLSIAICLSVIILQNCTPTKDAAMKQLTTKLQEAMKNQDVDAIFELYDDNAVMMISGESESLRGKEAIRANQEAWFRAFPDLIFDFGTVLSSNDEFCIEFTGTGKNTGPLPSPEGEIPPTGRTVKFSGAFLGKVSPEGLVIEDRTYFDNMDMMSQLGLVQQPLSDEDIAAIKAIGPALGKAALAGDWKAYVALCTEDGVWMLANSPIIQGRSAMTAHIESYVGLAVTEENIDFAEINGYGDIAYATGTYEETYTVEGAAKPIKDKGNELLVLRKQPNGSWLISYSSWNSDLSLPE